jgi:hypothetical protein
MIQKAKSDNTSSSRKKFLVWGAALLGFFGILKYMNRKEEEPPRNTVKMLSQDGTLVEVDASKIYCGNRKKVSDEELKNWVAKK